jgi:hypothetical protein
VSVERLAKLYLLEPDPNRGDILVLYGVPIHVTPDGDRALARRDPNALRAVVHGCRLLIHGWQARQGAST